jgi:hypothetical protein
MDFLTEESGDENFLNEDVIELNRLWRNELNAFEILPYQAQLIQDVLQLLHQQQVRVNALEKMMDESEGYLLIIYFFHPLCLAHV